MGWKPARRDELEYWFERMIHHAREALKASTEWRENKGRIQEAMDSHPRYQSEFTQRAVTESHWDLKDPMSAWDWHRREQQRWHDLIMAEYAMRQMLGAPKTQAQLLAEMGETLDIISNMVTVP